MKVNEGLYSSEMRAGPVRTRADYTNCGMDNKNSRLCRLLFSFIHPPFCKEKKVEKRGLPSIMAYCDVDLGGNAASRRNTESL
jgi:hypothetical protein